MTIVFATTMSPRGPTVIGRVLPLANQLADQGQVHVLVLGKNQKTSPHIKLHSVGREPFTRTTQGKIRLTGLPLAFHLFVVAVKTAASLYYLKPDVVIIVKSLPHNVLGVWLWSLFNKDKKIILDVDDFELTANVLTSFTQRAAIHWAERVGANLSSIVVCASPFLKDHFTQLTQNRKKVVMIPTGLSAVALAKAGPAATPSLLYIGSLSISSGHRVDLLPDILAQLIEKFPDTRLHIAGDGDDADKLKNQLARQGLKQHVRWHGRFTAGDVERLLMQAPILIDPIDAGIANRAKSSFRVMLAGAYGLPVVTSDVGIRPYLLPVKLHQRFFAEPANPKDYTMKIAALFEQPLTPDDQAALRGHSRQFTWHNLGKKYIKLFQP
ncbi:MAG: glycosyltransferase family 4 protein [bacterium]